VHTVRGYLPPETAPAACHARSIHLDVDRPTVIIERGGGSGVMGAVVVKVKNEILVDISY